ncbi:MAG: tol-pal system protein YbgF [Alphaproteobacteria bacterium HGW-Alphaproteobacteria-18]|nr:MAG: tol-pal system protein YbgF [Alphaproteobacteria bacterium HGW-Alphaproteobacteria-18]
MLKASLTGLAALGLLATVAVAQERGAPIVKGVTTGALSQQVDQTRQQTADLMLEINRNADRINQLSGRIETLEYELSRTRDDAQQQMLDNETLAQQNSDLRMQLQAQARAITALQMVMGVEATEQLDTGAGVGPASGPAPTSFPASSSSQTVGPAPSAQLGSGSGPSVLTPAPSSQGGLPEGSLGTISASQLPGEAGPLFAVARQRLLALDYAGAQEAFQSFVDKFGNDPQAGEAYFWLGETLHQQNAYAESGQAYTTMIRSFPDDTRAPDALARLARSMRLIGDTAKACQALDTLPKRYPNASKVVRDLAAVERTRSGCKG